jgi:tetratricopeptide (TPR) repeat protein
MARNFLCVLILLAVTGIACTSPDVRKQRYFESGNRHFDNGEFPTAIIEYRNAVQVDATFGAARKRLAESYTKIGDLPHALDEYVKAADLLPEDVDVQLTAGTLLLAARRLEDAVARADAALKAQPTNVQAHVLKGNALVGLSSFDEALKAIEEAIRLDPSRGTTFTNLGLVELARGRRSEAEVAFKKAVELAPKSVEAHLALGNFYWSSGKSAETEQAFRAALSVQPNHAIANRAMAALTIATGRHREAEQYLIRIADTLKTPEAEFALADYYLLLGQPQSAIARLEKLAAERKDSPAVGERLARAYAAAGDRTRATKVVEQVLAGNDAPVGAQLLKGQLLIDEGKREDAFKTVQAAASSHPQSAEAQFALARMYAARGDVTSAETAFREVLRINPRAAAAQVEIARLQLAAGRAADSVKTVEEVTRDQPKNIDARLTLVRSLLASKDLARAERELAALKTAYPNIAAVHAQAGALAILKGDVAAARAAYERAASLDPKSIDVLAGLIALDFKTNNIARAKTRIEERLKEGATPTLLLLAGRTYLAAQDHASAERVLRQTIEADPSLLTPYEMLGQLYMAQRRLDEARREFEALASKQTRPVGALTMSGMILQAQGNTALATKRYEDVLAIEPRAVIAANNLAWMYAEAGENLDVALQLAQTAVAESPETAAIIDTLGWVYYKKRQSQQAIQFFTQCVEKAPTNSQYHYHLGLAYLQAGDTALARASLQRALSNGAAGATAGEIKRLLADDAPTR